MQVKNDLHYHESFLQAFTVMKGNVFKFNLILMHYGTFTVSILKSKKNFRSHPPFICEFMLLNLIVLFNNELKNYLKYKYDIFVERINLSICRSNLFNVF